MLKMHQRKRDKSKLIVLYMKSDTKIHLNTSEKKKKNFTRNFAEWLRQKQVEILKNKAMNECARI